MSPFPKGFAALTLAAAFALIVTSAGIVPGPAAPLRGALAPSPSASPPSGPVPASAAPIAFVATTWCTAGAAHDILTIDPDRTDLTSVSCARGQDIDPAWSPDGRRIAFASNRTGDYEIWVMNADGSGATRLTKDAAADQHPAWSPDGTRIAFASGRSTTKNTTDLWVMNSDGSSPTRLLAMPGNERYPDWAPDGSRIVFSHFGGAEAPGIWTVRPDGTGAALVAGGALHNPQWSPDMSRIAYDGQPAGCSFAVYTMKADGTDRVKLVKNPDGCGSYDKHPSWSPDGKELVYSSSRKTATGQQTRLFTIGAAGGRPTLLVAYTIAKKYIGPYDPDWSWARRP